MSVTLNVQNLSALKKDIAEQRKLLEEQERAIALVEKMFAAKNIAQADLPTIAAPAQPANFADAARTVIRALPGEFKVADVETALKSTGAKMPLDARGRIAMIVGDLMKSEEVERTYKGAGPVPHRFRLSSKV